MSRFARRRSFTRLHPVVTTPRIVAHLLAKSVMVSLVLTATVALAQTDPSRVLTDVPGFDFSRLTAPAKRELASVLTDEELALTPTLKPSKFRPWAKACGASAAPKTAARSIFFMTLTLKVGRNNCSPFSHHNAFTLPRHAQNSRLNL